MARAQLEELAEGLQGASYGALAFAEAIDESQLRPLSALRIFAARHPEWSLYRGELLYRGSWVGRYTNEDPVHSIYVDMVFALMEQDYPLLSEESRRELALAAMRSWDRELAVRYLRAREEAPLAARR